jgi:alpha-N-acetylglucosamine transferase
MEKRAIVTRADQNVYNYTRYTHPIIKKYAESCYADFIVIGDEVVEKEKTEFDVHHQRVRKVYGLFDEYDRILQMDSDVLIRDNCPNLFDVVPEDSIGLLYEDVGSRKENRRARIKQAQEMFGDIGWTEGYINGGVSLYSRQHRDQYHPSWFEPPFFSGKISPECEASYRLKKLGFKVYDWGYKFNHMSMFSESWNNYASRFESYIIHYAGGGFYRFMPQWKQIKQDLIILTKYRDIKCKT